MEYAGIEQEVMSASRIYFNHEGDGPLQNIFTPPEKAACRLIA